MARKTITKETIVEDASACVGLAEAQEKVGAFCEDVARNPDIEGDVTILLSQVGTGSTAPIQSWVFSSGENPSEMSEVIVDAAVEDGFSIGRGVVKYAVTLEGFKGRKAFTLEFPEASDDDINEPPNEKGLTAQLMRHVERREKTFSQMFDTTNKIMARQLSEANARNERYEKQSLETMKAVEELLCHRHERDMLVKREMKSEDRKDELLGMVTNLGMPVIMSKFLGPANPMGSNMLLEGLVSSLKPEQLTAIIQSGALSQEQAIGLIELVKMVVATKEAKTAVASSSDEPPGERTH